MVRKQSEYVADLRRVYELHRQYGNAAAASRAAAQLRGYGIDVDGGERSERVETRPSGRLESAVESAPREDTAAPRVADHVCEECGYKAKTAGGLGAHQRTHNTDDD